MSEIKMLASNKELTVLPSLPNSSIRAEVDETSFRRMLLISSSIAMGNEGFDPPC